jgi:hypothetical protein
MVDLPEGPLLAGDGGRPRGPAGLALAWVTVLVHPRRFFRSVVVPGEQAPGLLFAMAVVAVEEATRFALVGPGTAYPVLGGLPVLSAVLWLGLAVLFVAPATIHLAAAVQTVILLPFVDDRGGVSETVQVIGYATAPCLLAGVPAPELRAAVTVWGAVVYVIGVSEVHGPWFEPAAILSAVPVAILFGYGFRGFDAIASLLARWYII